MNSSLRKSARPRTGIILPAAVAERTRVPCPDCKCSTIKSGLRKTRYGTIQKYYCPQCRTYRSASPIPRRRYAPAVILNAISAYNLGNTLDSACRQIARRFKVQVPASTLHAWLNQFANICTFIRYRKKFSFSEKDVIISRVFHHHQEYRFAFHRLKTNIFCKARFPEVRRYLWYVRVHCPNKLFTNAENDRCSDVPVKAKLTAERRPDNNAVALAKLGLLIAKRATERHEVVERFMLTNDTATIAVEVPVWLYANEAPDLKLAAPITGHIDILQVRGDYLYILDFKPDARHETRAKHQLFLYARALAARVKIPLSRIRCAYFDDKDYFEVIPGL